MTHRLIAHLEESHIIYLLKDQPISWNSHKTETLGSHWYFTKHTVYQSLIQPHITYGIAVWGQAAQTNLE